VNLKGDPRFYFFRAAVSQNFKRILDCSHEDKRALVYTKSKRNPHKVNETMVKMTNITEYIHIKKLFLLAATFLASQLQRLATNPLFEVISLLVPTGPLNNKNFLASSMSIISEPFQ
jgi:hypothetical protein